MNQSLKKLTLSGLLVASLFAGTTTQAIDKVQLAQRVVFGMVGISMIPSTFIHLMNSLGGHPILMPSSLGLTPWPSKWSSAALLYTNYKLLQYALTPPSEDAQKENEQMAHNNQKKEKTNLEK